ncbi:isochorismatase family protein [Actinoplanes sp. TFC3]|uniref:isochorismatase family protein n=1 Tax=Actinoplanes sp. TFC3 TaxID=1710355 RepID=UPI0009EAB0EB
MQRYFVDLLPSGEPQEVIATIARLRASGMPVVYSVQPGGMTRAERGLLHELWGPGMSTDPGQRAVVEPLTPRPGDRVVTKYRYSAFFCTGLADLLRDMGCDQVAVCGVYANIGVLATCVDAFSYDIKPFLISDAVTDFSPAEHLAALDYAARRCAVTISADDFLDRGRAAQPAPPARRSPASGRSAAGGS